MVRELWSGTLKGIYVPDVATLGMRSLIRLRNRIVKDTTREKNQIKSFLRFHGIDIPEEFTRHSVGNWSKRFLVWLREVLLSTEYGKEALGIYIEQFVRLLRVLSRSDALKEPIRLLTLRWRSR